MRSCIRSCVGSRSGIISRMRAIRSNTSGCAIIIIEIINRINMTIASTEGRIRYRYISSNVDQLNNAHNICFNAINDFTPYIVGTNTK